MDNSRKAGRQAQTTPVAARRAFEGYLRWGRAAHTDTEFKAVGRELSVKAVGDARPTNYYTWRTAHDERVRPAHAANEGRVFAWSDPPPTGHPGHDPNCRCTAEPYYGTPYVSDASLLLKREARVDPTGQAVWRNIDTLTRPDGSLAQSTILMRDGTTIRSTFNGQLVVNNVTLPDGRSVRLERNDGVQSVYIGNGLTPVVQSVWSADGPKVVGPRTRVAQAAEADDHPFSLWPGTPKVIFGDEGRMPGPRRALDGIDPRPAGPLDPSRALGAGVGALFIGAIVTFHELQKHEPAVLGGGPDDVAVLTLRQWEPDYKPEEPRPVPVLLTPEQVAQACKRLPDVQAWTYAAVAKLAPKKSGMTGQEYGKQVHKSVQQDIKAAQEADPIAYADLRTEYTISKDSPTEPGTYGEKGSSRLDIIELRSTMICVYDIKTGTSRLTPAKILEITKKIIARYGRVPFMIIEVRVE